MEFFNQAPKVIGAAFGQALRDGGGGGGGVASAVKNGGKMQNVTAGVGEAGEFECSQCKQPVALGPTAKQAVCSGCGARYPITRVEAEGTPPPPIAGAELPTEQEPEE